MEGRTHNLLNQSVAAGYRSRPGSNASSSAGKDQEGGGAKGEKKRPKRPRPGGPPAASRGAVSAGGEGGGGAAAAAGLVVERPSARYKAFCIESVPWHLHSHRARILKEGVARS